MKKKIPALLFLPLILLSACSKKSTTTNPTHPGGTTASMSYEMKAINPSSSIAHKGTATGIITWSSANAMPNQVKFEATQGSSEIEYKSNNSAAIDLLSTDTTGFGSFTLPAGTYSEVELKIELNASGSTPALQLNGSYSDGTVTIPVTFSLNENLELKTESHDVTTTASSSFLAVTSIDLSAITSGITASMITGATLTGGTLIISSSSNSDLYDIIKTNLSQRHHLEFDDDH